MKKKCYSCNEIKSINKFAKQSNKCNTCKNKLSNTREVNELPDYYIIKLLTRSKKKLDKSIITREQIENHKNILLLKRESKTDSNKKFCWGCNIIKNISEFKHPGCCITCKRLKCSNWKKNNKDKVRKSVNKRLAKNKEKLTDTYIVNNLRKTINQNNKLKILGKEIPQVLVELKRKELIIKTKIKNGKKTNKKSS
jgi:hypothetical protein